MSRLHKWVLSVPPEKVQPKLVKLIIINNSLLKFDPYTFFRSKLFSAAHFLTLIRIICKMSSDRIFFKRTMKAMLILFFMVSLILEAIERVIFNIDSLKTVSNIHVNYILETGCLNIEKAILWSLWKQFQIWNIFSLNNWLTTTYEIFVQSVE